MTAEENQRKRPLKDLVPTVREAISPLLPTRFSIEKVMTTHHPLDFSGYQHFRAPSWILSREKGTRYDGRKGITLPPSLKVYHKTTRKVNKVVFLTPYHTMWKSLILQESQEFSVWNQHCQAAVSHGTLTKPGIIWAFSQFRLARDWI